MAHYDILFPTDLDLGLEGGPEWLTEIAESGSGFEDANQRWVRPKFRWTAALKLKDVDTFNRMIGFQLKVKGRANSFLFKDPLLSAATLHLQGDGDGAETTFELRYAFDVAGETIYLPMAKAQTASVKDATGATLSNTLNVYVGSSPGTASPATISSTTINADGFLDVTLSAAPAAGAHIYASFTPLFAVRFGSDWMKGTEDFPGRGSFMGIEFREVRLRS